MLRSKLRRLPRLAATLCAAGVLLLPVGCNLPMSMLLDEGPPVPGPLSSGLTPPLNLSAAESTSDTGASIARAPSTPVVVRTSHHAGDASAAIAPKAVAIDLDGVLRLACERNAQIRLARERVNESQAAFEVAANSCMPEFLRKDAFKRANAEAQLWQHRAELSKTQNEVLQDAANTYFDGLTALRGEAIARNLEQYQEELLKREQALVSAMKSAQVLVESTQLALGSQRQFIAQVHQQGEAAAAKLAYLLGISDGVPAPADSTPAPIDVVDADVPVEMLIGQALDNGPGVRELQGLIAAIQKGIDEARCAQRLCDRMGAVGVCGRLHIAQSKWQQAQLSLVDLRGKLRAGVADARSAILSGREQIARGADAIQHAAETYRLANLRVKELPLEQRLAQNAYDHVLTSIQQLGQAHARYLSAVSAYNKAEVRLLLLIGTYRDCQPSAPLGTH